MTQIPVMLIDVHAHFYHDRTPRADWRERNASRLSAGDRIGVTHHVASILGSWGLASPTYFPSPRDLEYGNDALLALERQHPDRIRGYVTVNPNYAAHASAEIARCLDAGMVGIKLAASRRAPSGRTVHSRPHRRWRRLAALARGPAHGVERVRRSLGERRGRRHARGVPRVGGRGAAGLGHRPDHGDRVGQAALPHVPAVARAARARQMEERRTHLPARRVPRRLMRIDVNAFLGAYPYRRVAGTSPERLLQALERTAIDEAWVSHLPSLFWRQPMDGNAWLYDTVARERRLRAVPAVHRGSPAGRGRWAKRPTVGCRPCGAIRRTTVLTQRGPRCGSSPQRAARRTCPS